MSLELGHPSLAAHLPRLSPYLRGALERAAEHALALHSDVLALEHLVGALLRDEESALHRLVLHAFADPETIAFDVLALSPGILVVASDATLPFSTRAVEALFGARARSQAEVGSAALLDSALATLPEEVLAALHAAGLSRELPRPVAAPAGGPHPAGNVFHGFSKPALQSLSRAARSAFRAHEPTIGPARIVLALLEFERELEASSGLGRQRARLVLEGRTVDLEPPADRPLAPDERLSGFLAALPEGAASLAVLAALHRDPSSELAQAFTRQKVSAALLERASQVLHDP